MPKGILTGRMLNQKWNIGAKHSLYNAGGKWYHQLRKFPGALCDVEGYMLFKTREELRNNPYLRIGQDINIPGGISSMPNYKNIKQLPSELYNIEDTKALEGYQHDKKYLYTERNKKIVAKRKEKDNYTCQVCKFKLKINEKYIIECHHVIPFTEISKRVTNINDLICLCPTCHRIAHIRKFPYSVKEIKNILNNYLTFMKSPVVKKK